MSRNSRYTPSTPSSTPKKTPKKTPRKARTNDTSDDDDDDYDGVDLITDSEEDEPDVEVAEEQAIIESEEDEDDESTPRPEQDDDQSSWGGFELDDDQSFLGNIPFFDEHMARSTEPDLYTEATAWASAHGGSDDGSATETSRRVRFDISDSDNESEDNIFPDIFLDQNKLDPSFRQTIENDRNNDNDDPSSDEGSYWDFRGDEAETPENPEVEEDNKSESSFGSSGYETDEGETTEEDLPPAAKFVPARSVLRRQSTESSASEDIPVIRRNPYRPSQRNGPRLGTWVTDASKPFAVIDSRGKKMMMFKAKIGNRRFSFNGTGTRPVSARGFEGLDDVSTMEQMSPMISNSANMMMSAMYTPMDGFLGGNALGPPEAFYPFVSIAANGAVTQDSTSSSFEEEEEDDVDDDELWNIRDLIDFGDDSTDDEDGDEDDENGTPHADRLSSTPARPTTANSEEQVHPLLEHLDRGMVGAFRQNQTRHALLSRNAASRDSLAFSGPYRQGTLRGIKGGRLAAANTPITPLRKTKAVKADVNMSPSPLKDAAERKRKFSGEQHTHKRSRSMV